MVNLNHLDHRTLLLRAQAGDQQALAELYEQLAPAIKRYMFARVNDEALVEDLKSEVFEQMVRSLPRFQDRGIPVAGWLFRIARARVVDHFRRTARRGSEDMPDDLTDPGPDPEAEVLARAEIDRLEAAIASLPARQRQVIHLRFPEGRSFEEIGQVLGLTIGAVKALQHRALGNLAERLGRET